VLEKSLARKIITHYGNEYLIGKQTGYKDKDDTPIKIGDLVEYYFSAHPSTLDPGRGTYADDASNGHTLMEDTVVEHNGYVYFMDPVFGGGFAWRHAPHCKVVGSVA